MTSSDDDDGWLYHCLTPQQHLRLYRGGDHDDDDGWLYHCLTPQQHLRSYRGDDDDDGEIRTRRNPINGDKMGILLGNKWETVILRATSQTQWSIQQHYVFQPGHFVSWGLRQEVWTGRL